MHNLGITYDSVDFFNGVTLLIEFMELLEHFKTEWFLP